MIINSDVSEINKFNQMAAQWWDLQGVCRLLHAINPLRMQFIQQFVDLAGQQVLDIGCGGGILSESLAKQGGTVTAIDLAADALAVAKQHAEQQQLIIDYRQISAEQLAELMPQSFDAITCMELLEHVPDPTKIIAACARLIKPGGYIFLSTINRTPKAYLQAILGAEYLLRWLPRGTHDYARFIQPTELAAWLRQQQLQLLSLQGMDYQPLGRYFYLTKQPSVNYLVCCQAAGE